MKRFLLFVLCCSLLLVPLTIAHKVGGYDEVVGDYLVDVSWNLRAPNTLEPLVLDFALLKQGVPQDADVWIRIIREEEFLFAGNLESSAPFVTFAFSEDGIHDITVRFTQDSEDVAEITFPLWIQPEEKKLFQAKYLGFGAIVLLGFFVFFQEFKLVRRRDSNEPSLKPDSEKKSTQNS